MNGPITWALALICLVVVLVVREAYRDERLGAALLVGAATGTAHLLREPAPWIVTQITDLVRGFIAGSADPGDRRETGSSYFRRYYP
ncbi:hypothetical protein Sros01_72660 [Streptomyces roseochromogenus]|nr:hypothetical protein Sros01_72660 [Streptomyces roseochromogenus]